MAAIAARAASHIHSASAVHGIHAAIDPHMAALPAIAAGTKVAIFGIAAIAARAARAGTNIHGGVPIISFIARYAARGIDRHISTPAACAARATRGIVAIAA